MKKLYAKITKVDEVKREVYGTATAEVEDQAGEIFDYETSKPFFQAWSESVAKDTSGLSLGNVRAMHGKVAAGKLTQIEFDDTQKSIEICAKIVDSSEWEKVTEGVYTGFSIGGSYEKRWDDPVLKSGKGHTLKRFTANPVEISIVDRPCVPSATFQMIKLDGSTEEVQFKAKKGLYGVARLAQLLDDLNDLRQSAGWEADYEGDASPLPERLKEAVVMLAEILKEMVSEETAELTGEAATMQMAASANELRKAGARNSKADMEKLQTMHDMMMEMGATCVSGEKVAATSMQKLADTDAALIASRAELETVSKTTTALTEERDTLQKRIAELEQKTAPIKVAKAEGVISKDSESTGLTETQPTTAAEAIRKIHAGGGVRIA